MEWKPIVPKYKSKEAKYYRRKLAAKAENREFKEDPPLKNIEDALSKGVNMAKEAGGKAEIGLKKVGNYLSGKLQMSGEKVRGVFGKKQTGGVVEEVKEEQRI